MPSCLFVSDLHGQPGRYRALFDVVARERPAALFVGGDLFPHEMAKLPAIPGGTEGFLAGFLADRLRALRAALGPDYPRVFVILGNDDARFHEAAVLRYAAEGLWTYVHRRCVSFEDWLVCGYATIPPSPFQLKDWERYDVSRYVDPGCVPPEGGRRTIAVPERELQWATIADELERLAEGRELSRALCLFHCPPHRTLIDRADLDGKTIDHAPVDVHIGSIAVRRFLERHRPWMGLHGHVHEAARLTGHWSDRVGDTPIVSAAHDGPELALVRFEPEAPEAATRELIAPIEV
ncbi:MAG TPA: metallophosphoesterase [Candidatus Krumholzibacteria bacterium]|nr:metallophosphoesterase [Candidatus Krumholzibacteria bacterium]